MQQEAIEVGKFTFFIILLLQNIALIVHASNCLFISYVGKIIFDVSLSAVGV